MSYGGTAEPVGTPKASSYEAHDGHSPTEHETPTDDEQTPQILPVDVADDKVLFWVAVGITAFFGAILLPLGIYCASTLYKEDLSNYYDYSKTAPDIIKNSAAVQAQYNGQVMGINPLFIDMTSTSASASLVDPTGLKPLLDELANTLRVAVAKNASDPQKPYWANACAFVASNFNENAGDALYNGNQLVTGNGTRAIIKLLWRYDKIMQPDLDSLWSTIKSSVAFRTGEINFDISGPAMLQSAESPSVVVVSFALIFVVIFFFAVAARTSPVSFIVPVLYITITTVLASGFLLAVDKSVQITGFSVVVAVTASLALTGSAVVTILQRMVINFTFDEAHSRSVPRRTVLAFVDEIFTMLLPAPVALCFFLISSTADEAIRATSLCLGLSLIIVVLCSVTLLPSIIIFTYPLVFREYDWWSRFVLFIRLPASLRRISPEEARTAQLLVHVAGHENDDQAGDSGLREVVKFVKKFPVFSFLIGINVILIFAILMLASSTHLRSNYLDIIRRGTGHSSELKSISQAFGVGAMSPYFLIYERLDTTSSVLSEKDFDNIVTLTNTIVQSKDLLNSPTFSQLVSVSVVQADTISYQQYVSFMSSQNNAPNALLLKAIAQSVTTYDNKYVVVKMLLPSLSDTFFNMHADFASNLQSFTESIGFSLKDPKFIGFYGPNVAIVGALKNASDNFKIEAGVGFVFLLILYIAVARAPLQVLQMIVFTILSILVCFCFAAFDLNLDGFFYTVPCISLPLMAMFIAHDFVVSTVELRKIRERGRFSEDRCAVELLNRTESLRWSNVSVFVAFFFLIFTNTELLSSIGLGVCFSGLVQLFFYNLIIAPSLNSLFERFNLLQKCWWPRGMPTGLRSAVSADIV